MNSRLPRKSWVRHNGNQRKGWSFASPEKNLNKIAARAMTDGTMRTDGDFIKKKKNKQKNTDRHEGGLFKKCRRGGRINEGRA